MRDSRWLPRTAIAAMPAYNDRGSQDDLTRTLIQKIPRRYTISIATGRGTGEAGMFAGYFRLAKKSISEKITTGIMARNT